MNKKTFFYYLAAIVFCLNFAACEDEGTERSATHYYLPQGCDWKSNIEEDKLYRIDNLEELKAVVDYNNENNLPKINFEQTTLLLVATPINSIGYDVDCSLIPTGRLSYIYDIKVKNTGGMLLPAVSVYYIAIKTEKINKNAAIRYQIELPY